MSIFLNPVVFSVILMCILCLCKLNVMFSLIIACFVGGLMGGMSVSDISSTMLAGFSNNAEAALAYILLGTFASCLAYTGLADIFAKRVAQAIRGSKLKLFLLILIFSIISQTIIPIHTAYIPILIPPMLAMMNEMKMDRRLMAGALVSGMMPYVGIPIGYGLIFMGIVKDNMCANGLTVTVQQVYSVNWMLMLTFIPGIIYIWFRYRKPREYKNVDVDLSAYNAVESTKLELRHWISIIAVLVVTAVEFKTQSLAVAALAGLVIMFFSGAVKWKDIEERFNDGRAAADAQQRITAKHLHHAAAEEILQRDHHNRHNQTQYNSFAALEQSGNADCKADRCKEHDHEDGLQCAVKGDRGNACRVENTVENRKAQAANQRSRNTISVEQSHLVGDDPAHPEQESA